MRSHPANARHTDLTYELSEAMHGAAVIAFYACERFGKFSKEHNAASLDYEAAKAAYEAACDHDGVAPYLDPCKFFS